MISPGMMIVLGDPFPEEIILTWEPDLNLLSLFTLEKGKVGMQCRGSREFSEAAGHVLLPILLAHPSPRPEEQVWTQNGILEKLKAWQLLQDSLDKLNELGLNVERGPEGYVLLPRSRR